MIEPHPTVLIVGAGGIGAPAAIALAGVGIRSFIVADDDLVEESNLHRQILFGRADVGTPKADALASAIERLPNPLGGARAEPYRARALPENVLDLVDRADVVVDATDNFASRFLLADAAFLRGVPIVHAAAVRLHATVMATSKAGMPCYRCVFEDIPEGVAQDCATSGILGPVCGVAGALAAELTARVLGLVARPAFGVLWTFDGARDRLREVPIRPRPSCPLCGDKRSLVSIDEARYEGPDCSAGAPS
ncbi:MAG: HesA/MoeB/ThiF family protein [Polyangiaceae bacterium]